MKMLKVIKFISLMILFSTIIIGVAIAETFYIATNGSDSNDGSINSPWATLDKAHSVMKAGDTLYIRGGTYTQNQTVLWTKSGTQTQPIIIKAYPGEGPKFNGNSFSSNLFYIREADWIVIDGLEVYGYNNAVWMGYSGSGTNYAEHNTIRNSYFHDTGEHNIYLSWGIKNVEIYNNFLKNPGNGNKYAIHGYHGPGVNGVKVYNNIIIEARGGIIFADGARDIEIYNNVLYNNTVGLDFSYRGEGDGSEGWLKNATIKNNIIYSTNSSMWGMQVAGANINEIRSDHNLWYRPNGHAVIEWDGNAYTLSQYQANTSNGDHCIDADPLFTNLSLQDFHLQSNSPARDRGAVLAGLVEDKDGITRPQGSGYDIGAYEYVLKVPPHDTEAPAVPTGIAATAISSSRINLSWRVSTDNVGVVGYRIYRNETAITTTPNISYSDTGLSPSTIYTYSVSAYDLAGNESKQSVSVSQTTLHATTPNENLIAFWTFDETIGQMILDSSGNNNNGNLGTNNAAEIFDPARTTGKIKNGLQFDGTDDRVTVDGNSALNNLSSFTCMTWIYPTGWGGSGYGRILSKESASGFDEFYFHITGINAKNFGVGVSNTAGVRFGSDASISSIKLNTWQHVAVTYDDFGDRKLHLYLNGNEVTYQDQKTVTGTLNRTSNSIIIGNRVLGDRSFQGKIDEVKIYNRVLSATEIQYASNQAPPVDTTPPDPPIGLKWQRY